MRGEQEALTILDRLRQSNRTRAKISELLSERYSGEIPNHTGAGIFGAAIARLLDTELINLYTQDGVKITAEIKSIGDNNRWSLFRGYAIAAELRGREHEIEVMLTDRLPNLQDALGVSVTQLMEEFSTNWFRVNPVFGKPTGSPTSDVFVLMPFKEELSPVYDDHIFPVCKLQNLTCMRADDLFGSNIIIQDVWELIANSKILIADCSGRNPNVFYELGIAHTLGKKVIVIAQSEQDIPFDIRHIRYIKYNYTPRGMREFESTLSKYLLQA